MEKAKLDSLVDLKDNYGNFTGYSVDSDGVVVNTSNCPFPFLDEPQDGEILCNLVMQNTAYSGALRSTEQSLRLVYSESLSWHAC